MSLRTHGYVNKCLITIGVPKNGVFSYKDDHIHRCVSVLQYQVAQALNPPIKVTQAVLDDCAKAIGAKFLGIEPCDSLIPFSVCNDEEHPFDFDCHFTCKESLKNQFIHIKAESNCPLALQVLLGFTTEGVPKDD